MNRKKTWIAVIKMLFATILAVSILLCTIFNIISEQSSLISMDSNSININLNFLNFIFQDESSFSDESPQNADQEPFSMQPQECTVKAGDILHFSVQMEDPESYSYQWQYSIDGKSWMDSKADDSKSSELSYIAESAYTGRLYRCKVIDQYGYEYFSNMAMLVVEPPDP